MPIKIAFAGSGYINKIHARSARAAGAELSAVVNHKTESMRAFAEEFSIPRQFGSVDELIRSDLVHALVVSTPNYLHASQSMAALRAGVHVLVEKPIAMNAAEAEEMWKTAQHARAKLMVAHCWRFDPEAIWLRQQVAAGKIGEVIRTKGCGVHVAWGPSGWFTEKRYAGGGAMADMGVHALDTARFLLGDPQPVSVYARIGTYYGDYDVDDTGVVIVNWDTGATSYFESGWWQPHADMPNAGTQLYGRSGFASLFPTRVERRVGEANLPQVEDGGFVHPRESHAPQSLYDAQMKYFLECILQDRPPVPGGIHGLANMKVVDAAYESSRTGKVVDVS